MSFSISRQNGIVIVSLNEKRLDSANAPRLKQLLIGLLDEGVNEFVLDFAAVELMDSSGLGILISLKKQLDKKGGIVLCHIQNSSILDILRLTRMDRLFEIADSCDEAVRKLQA